MMKWFGFVIVWLDKCQFWGAFSHIFFQLLCHANSWAKEGKVCLIVCWSNRLFWFRLKYLNKWLSRQQMLNSSTKITNSKHYILQHKLYSIVNMSMLACVLPCYILTELLACVHVCRLLILFHISRFSNKHWGREWSIFKMDSLKMPGSGISIVSNCVWRGCRGRT